MFIIVLQNKGLPFFHTVIFILDCESPNIPNGYLTDGSDTFYSGTATANCDTGYELAGSDVAICLSNGTWDTLPVCNLQGNK